MTIILVIAGLILLLAGAGWFTGAATVGIILLAVGVVGVIVQLVAFAAAARRVSSVHRDFRSNFGRDF